MKKRRIRLGQLVRLDGKLGMVVDQAIHGSRIRWSTGREQWYPDQEVKAWEFKGKPRQRCIIKNESGDEMHFSFDLDQPIHTGEATYKRMYISHTMYYDHPSMTATERLIAAWKEHNLDEETVRLIKSQMVWVEDQLVDSLMEQDLDEETIEMISSHLDGRTKLKRIARHLGFKVRTIELIRDGRIHRDVI